MQLDLVAGIQNSACDYARCVAAGLKSTPEAPLLVPVENAGLVYF